MTVPLLARENMGAAVAALQNADDILLVCHVNPDGDTLGSLLGLAYGLDAMGKKTTLVSADGVPVTLQFLPGISRLQTETPRRDFPLAVVLDAGDLSRTGSAKGAVLSARTVIDIDHHVTAGAFGDIRILDAHAAATAEIVYDVLLSLDIPLTKTIAECLLCGLLTDTGSFRFMNVTPRTMALAGAMIALGASPNTIAECVFENKSWGGQKLLGRALDNMKKSDDGRIVWTHVSQNDFAEFGATDEDTEGVVSAIRTVRGADAAAFLRETPEGTFRVSLRARDPLDVSVVAAKFGGGGHRLASGCSLPGPIARAEAELIDAVQAQINQTPLLASSAVCS